MARYKRYTLRLMLMLLTLLYSVRGEAKLADRYNEQHPLVIVCDWELAPYEFLDDGGTPSGYTVELLKAILDKLNISYQFVLKENPLVLDSVDRHQTGLFMVSSYQSAKADWHLTSNVISYYKVKVATQKNAPPVSSLEDIDADKLLIIRLDSRIVAPILKDLPLKASVEYHAPMEALAGVSSGKYDYFIWGEEPLKWKIRELNLENIRLNDVDVLAAELRLAGYDKELITAIDDQYARLEQDGDLDVLRDKWFHPERHHDNGSPLMLYSVIAAVLLLLVLFLIHRLASQRVRKMTLRNSEQTRLMNLALDMGGYMVSEYDPRRDTFKNQRGQLMNEQSNMADVEAEVHPDDHQAFLDKVEELKQRDVTSSELMVRRNDGTAAAPHWQYLQGNCIKERDEDTRKTTFLMVAKDITKDMAEQHRNDEQAVLYMKAFETSLVAMSFYDAEGHLLDMNARMRDIVGAQNPNQEFFNETLLWDAPLFRNILYKGMTEVVHACQHMHYPDIHLDKYLEYRLRPVFNDDGEIRYYAMTVRDVTSERNLYREQQAIERQLRVTDEEAKKFESQLNYLLSNTHMFIWHSNYNTRMIEVARSLHKVDYTFSFDEYVGSVVGEEKDSASATFYNPLMRAQPVNFIRHYEHSVLTNRNSWFAVSGTPVLDKNGLSQGHFGVIRDITQLMQTQEELRSETARAQQSGQLKTTFLANMTHEIRTPLNAIVGFSDLLHMTEAPEDRKEFIRIIRHNCDLLLRLIDDILETSTMSERPQSIEAEDTDFAVFFNEVCQTVAQRVQEPGVSFITDNPYTTFPACTDKERVQQVITNFVTNAVKYTREGHIKVGYRAEDDGILIYCEDTGAGIPKEKQATVFDRFVKLNDYVQGTGLGLSICKAIAERCGGRIGLSSEGEGKGSTFWIWIPRYLTSSNLTAEK